MSPTTVAQVLTRMRDIASDLPAGDGAGVFNGVYLKVTEMMQDRLNTRGVFRNNAFVTDLDVNFADYWFNAYDAPGDKPRAWAPKAGGAIRKAWVTERMGERVIDGTSKKRKVLSYIRSGFIP